MNIFAHKAITRWIGTGILLGLCLSSVVWAAAPAQDPMGGQQAVPMMEDEFQFIPGTWGLYKLTPQEGSESQMRFSVMEEVRQRRGRAFWVEIEIASSTNPTVVTRVLLPETESGPGDAKKAYVQIEGYRPFEVPRKYLRPNQKKKQEGVGEFTKFKTLGEPEEKTVEWKGRTLQATVVKSRDQDGNPVTVTISKEAPPLSILMMDSSAVGMELLDWGTGAETQLTGKPIGLWRWVFGLVVNAAAEGSPEE